MAFAVIFYVILWTFEELNDRIHVEMSSMSLEV